MAARDDDLHSKTGTAEDAARAWDYIIDLYDDEGVKDACLRLQEDYNVNVSLLLFVLWLAAEGRRLPDVAAMKKLTMAVAAWDENVVKVLRRLRRSLKELDDEGAGRIAHMILSSEIEAEREAMAPLARLATVICAPIEGEKSAAMADQVALYLEACGAGKAALPHVKPVVRKAQEKI